MSAREHIHSVLWFRLKTRLGNGSSYCFLQSPTQMHPSDFLISAHQRHLSLRLTPCQALNI